MSCEVANAGHRRTRVQALLGGFREDLSEEDGLEGALEAMGVGGGGRSE